MKTKAKFEPFLDVAAFEIRYASGYTYLDRCGQTLLDIERDMPGWVVTGEPAPTGGALAHHAERSTMTFNANLFNLVAQSPVDVPRFGDAAMRAWAIVRSNLGLSQFIRVGCRLSYLLARNSPEGAETVLARAALNVALPKSLSERGYHPKTRQVVVVLQKDSTEYRTAIQAVARAEGAQAPLLTADPRMLTKAQRNARIAIERSTRRTTYAVQLDVDCAQHGPERIDVRDFVATHDAIVRQDFLPILGAL